MSPMAGGEGSLARGTSKSAAAAGPGPQGPLKRYPTKRNAKKEAAAATGPHGSSKGCSTKRKAARDPASGRMSRPRATESATGRKARAEVPVGEQKKRLSKGDINWILNQKPLVPPSNIAALKRSNPELVPRPGEEADEGKMRLYRLAKAFDEMEERRPRLQAWVRSELKSKGYIELDDEAVKRRAEVQAVIDREWPVIQAKLKALILSEEEDEREYQGGEGAMNDSLS